MAQTPDSVRVDTEQARALVVAEQPRLPGVTHDQRMNRILIYLSDGEMSFTSPEGFVEKIACKAGEVRWDRRAHSGQGRGGGAFPPLGSARSRAAQKIHLRSTAILSTG
jgi:hypothetical protein